MIGRNSSSCKTTQPASQSILFAIVSTGRGFFARNHVRTHTHTHTHKSEIVFSDFLKVLNLGGTPLSPLSICKCWSGGNTAPGCSYNILRIHNVSQLGKGGNSMTVFQVVLSPPPKKHFVSSSDISAEEGIMVVIMLLRTSVRWFCSAHL